MQKNSMPYSANLKARQARRRPLSPEEKNSPENQSFQQLTRDALKASSDLLMANPDDPKLLKEVQRLNRVVGSNPERHPQNPQQNLATPSKPE